MKPEEEDRLAEISRRLVPAETAEVAQSVEVSDPEFLNAYAESPREVSSHSGESANSEPDIIQPDGTPAIFSQVGAKETSRPGLGVVLLVLAIAVTLAGGLWWRIRHQNPSPLANPSQAASAAATLQTKPSPAVEEELATSGANSIDASVSGENPGGLPRVTGIRHSSSADSNTVIVDLQDQVQYEAHRLNNPDRIYIDLHDTGLAPGLFGKTIEVKEALLTRVRIAQPVRGVTRVVLETRGASDFSVRLESNPYRLVVEVHGVAANTPPTAQPQTQPQTKMEIVNPVAPPGQKALASPAPLTSAQPTPPNDRQGRSELAQFRIVLDAGHGGWDLGTVGRKGLLEKDLVLDIVQRLGNLVQSRLGAQVIYTRQDDSYIALEKRAEIANLSRADLFLSIHANYSDDSSARGVETYYTNTYSSVRARPPETEAADNSVQNVSWTNVDIRAKVHESRQFAANVQHALYGMLAAKTPGIRNRGVKHASYVVLTGTSMPAILAEVSFVSSPEDESKLKSSVYRQQIAEALYKGIAHYTATSRRVDIASTSDKPAGQ
jgi:N-acetylmuramoyl-L-alanine amidase